MSSEQRIKQLEEEIKVLKGEIKTVLLDIREHYLNLQNPFVQRMPDDESLLPENGVQETDNEKPEDVPAEPPGEEVAQESFAADSQPHTPESPAYTGKTRVDPVTIAGLARWVDQAAARIGKEKVAALVEVCSVTGHLPSSLREVLLKFAHLSEARRNDGRATASDYLALVLQLEALMGRSSQSGAALLAILSDDNDDEGGQS